MAAIGSDTAYDVIGTFPGINRLQRISVTDLKIIQPEKRFFSQSVFDKGNGFCDRMIQGKRYDF
jgi:hypothetical protein